MAPNLRSSAPTTPSGKTSSGSNTPTLTPRKTPHCTKCKRPRAGHPRSGCPYADSPLKDIPSAAANLTDALGSMHIASPARERDNEDIKAEIRNRRRSSIQSNNLAPAESLMSLSTESQEIVERLLQPGMFDDTDEEDSGTKEKERTRVVRWQETVLATPIKSKVKVKMPGTLNSPSPDSSLGSMGLLGISENTATQEATPPATPHISDSLSSSTPTQSHRPQPLVRSMSLEERDVFVAGLTMASDATVYVLPSADIYDIQQSAVKLGYHARIVLSREKGDPQGLLVLGRNEKAVRNMASKVEKESEKVASESKVPAGRLGAVAGGAVVGAVGAWAGLAFA